MYAKVFTQIYDGTLCTNGPWQALVTFQQLLVLADVDGNVDMTPAAIARRTTIPAEIIAVGIDALLKPDPESRTPTEEGRRIVPLSDGRGWGWRIVNYKHYRDLKREEDRREYHREYWHKRKAKDSNASTASTETQHAQQNQPKKDREEDVEKKTSRASRSPSSIPGVDPETFADWSTLRKVKKAPITATAIAGIEREAAKAGLSMQQALAMACERGWTGFKADWVKSAPVAGSHGDVFAGAR